MIISPCPAHPLAIAHRAGNHLEALRQARAAGVDLIEADVWLYRGRIEVRHLKTIGPVPVLWDRWQLAPGWTPRLELAALLAGLEPGTELMLDLKGTSPRLSEGVLDALGSAGPGRRVTVCSRNWSLLEAFGRRPAVRVVHSIGSVGQLRAFAPLMAGTEPLGISIRHSLLSPSLVRRLRERVDLIMTWTVNTPARMAELLCWGVHGIISDDLALLRSLVSGRTAPEAAVLR